MHVAQFAFLCLFLAPFLTIAQTDSRKSTVSWKLTIAGHTDSITTDEILLAGKLECPQKAFEKIGFTVGGCCIYGTGMYREVTCDSAAFSPLARTFISRLLPGSKLYLSNIKLRTNAGQMVLSDDQVIRICGKADHPQYSLAIIGHFRLFLGLLQLYKSFFALNQYIILKSTLLLT